MQALLSFDQAPPFSAPARFFLTAPLFGFLAGLLLLIEGSELLVSRWMPAALAFVHLLTLGFMMQIMLGALIQILPVVAGANLQRPRLIAFLIHAGLALGTLALAGGFLFAQSEVLLAGGVVVALSAVVFLGASFQALQRVPSTSPTIRGIKLALAGLAGVVLLGCLLVYGLQQGLDFSLTSLTDLHAAWGFSAWGGILLLSMAYVVVPMFQLTPAYSSRAAWAGPSVFLLLVLIWSLALGAGSEWLIRLARLALAVLGLFFAAWTLRLQSQRRRAKVDANSHYWQLGMWSIILAAVMLLTAGIWPALGEGSEWEMVFFVLLMLGGFVSCMSGMLYKIVPFLAWLHLQNEAQGQRTAPSVNRLLPDVDTLRQFKMHTVVLWLCLLAVYFPDYLARPAGLGLMLSMLWLAHNLWSVMRRYRDFSLLLTKEVLP